LIRIQQRLDREFPDDIELRFHRVLKNACSIELQMPRQLGKLSVTEDGTANEARRASLMCGVKLFVGLPETSNNES
jgi:hypothetical protein